VHGDAEISPPLFFVTSWLTTAIHDTPAFVRGPSLIAGAVSIPVVYLLGLRTVGRSAALVSAAITAVAPFMIHQSTEARGYALMMLLVALSTLAMLLAVDTRRARWWVLYGACSCAAMYTHYTCAFTLGAQLAWLLWAHPEARRPALLANLAAALAFLPWTSGLLNDLDSPTTDALSGLYPFNSETVTRAVEHWSIGDPLAGATKLSEFPGTPALVLLALGLAVALVGIAWRVLRNRDSATFARLNPRLVLVAALLFSAPVGEAVLSALSTNVLNTRNLASSWPSLALALGALLTAAGPVLGVVAALLVLAGFGLGAAKMLTPRFHRPDYQAAAHFIDRNAAPGEIVIDTTGLLSPAPITHLEVGFEREHPVVRTVIPRVAGNPFGSGPRSIPLATAASYAVAAANGSRIFLVSFTFPLDANDAKASERTPDFPSPVPAPYRRVESHVYPGSLGVVVRVYARPSAG
jgi:4-amino-4-deoxy-L-arabinose transferase-like glycosyltransferase